MSWPSCTHTRTLWRAKVDKVRKGDYLYGAIKRSKLTKHS